MKTAAAAGGSVTGAIVWCLQASAKLSVLQMFIGATICSTAGVQLYDWLDAPGASLIVTLRKAWETSMPQKIMAQRVLGFLSMLTGRARGHGVQRPPPPAAFDSAALAIAHLLPLMLRCAPPAF